MMTISPSEGIPNRCEAASKDGSWLRALRGFRGDQKLDFQHSSPVQSSSKEGDMR